jgi:hypothetical protein
MEALKRSARENGEFTYFKWRKRERREEEREIEFFAQLLTTAGQPSVHNHPYI